MFISKQEYRNADDPKRSGFPSEVTILRLLTTCIYCVELGTHERQSTNCWRVAAKKNEHKSVCWFHQNIKLNKLKGFLSFKIEMKNHIISGNYQTSIKSLSFVCSVFFVVFCVCVVGEACARIGRHRRRRRMFGARRKLTSTAAKLENEPEKRHTNRTKNEAVSQPMITRHETSQSNTHRGILKNTSPNRE